MRVLGVGAHPDDLEILAGGTLARYVREGHDVVMCHASAGDCGHLELGAEEIMAVRRREAQRAAAIAGAVHATLDLRDGAIDASDASQKRAMVDLVREVR